jgi:hypothetical protein
MEGDAVLVSATLDGSEALRQKIRSVHARRAEGEINR